MLNQSLMMQQDDDWVVPSIWDNTHRDKPLVSGDGQDRVVGIRPASRWVDDDVDVLVDDRRRRWLGKHYLQVLRLEHGLSRIEREPGELGLDQVGPVLHDGPEELVAAGALPANTGKDKLLLRNETDDERKERLLWDQM